jgi:hypothetical protein
MCLLALSNGQPSFCRYVWPRVRWERGCGEDLLQCNDLDVALGGAPVHSSHSCKLACRVRLVKGRLRRPAKPASRRRSSLTRRALIGCGIEGKARPDGRAHENPSRRRALPLNGGGLGGGEAAEPRIIQGGVSASRASLRRPALTPNPALPPSRGKGSLPDHPFRPGRRSFLTAPLRELNAPSKRYTGPLLAWVLRDCIVSRIRQP